MGRQTLLPKRGELPDPRRFTQPSTAGPGHKVIECADHGTGGPGTDACRIRGLVSESILNQADRRPAVKHMGCNR